MIELLGDFPPRFAQSGKHSNEFFRRNSNELRNISRLKPWGLGDVLREKYGFSEREARATADFLLPMLRLDPGGRATADAMLRSPWLDEGK
jgi:serine/threonine protein kinase